jgi:hypothetical protein
MVSTVPISEKLFIGGDLNQIKYIKDGTYRLLMKNEKIKDI